MAAYAAEGVLLSFHESEVKNRHAVLWSLVLIGLLSCKPHVHKLGYDML